MTTVTESWRKLLQFQWQRTKQRPTLSSCSFFFNTYIPYFYSATSQNKSKLNLHVGCVVQVTPHHLHQQLNWAHEGYQILKQRYPPPQFDLYPVFYYSFSGQYKHIFFLEKENSSLRTTITGDAIQWTGVKAPLHLNVPDIGIVYEGHSRALLYTPREVPPDDQPLAPWQINAQ